MKRLLQSAAGIALALIGTLALVGCMPTAVDPSADPAEVQAAVRAYNEALVRAYAEMDMNELNLTATEEQAQEEFLLMAALGEGRRRMLSTLQSIEFGEAIFPAQAQASVSTEEVWDYQHVSLDTSETIRSEEGVVYRLRYDLVYRNGRWLVSGVTSTDDVESPAEEITP